MKLTPEQKKTYLDSGGTSCPYCGDGDIIAPNGVEVEGGTAWQELGCNICGKSWNDVYNLVDVEDADVDDDHDPHCTCNDCMQVHIEKQDAAIAEEPAKVPPMTFEEFQKTGYDTDDVGAVLQDESFMGIKGRIYGRKDCPVFLEDATSWKNSGAEDGRWHTVIGRESFQNNDIAVIEKVLYEYALGEELLTPVPSSKEALAKEFIRVIQSWLTPEQCAEIDLLNENEEDPNVCHTHDYCDANMAMDAAFRGLGITPSVDYGEDVLPNRQKATDLWNAAWDIAKKEGFEYATDESRSNGPRG